MNLFVCLKQQWNGTTRPRNYVPGATLTRLAHDLTGLTARPISATCWQFSQSGAKWNFTVSEQVQRQFLMHIVSSRFVMPVTQSNKGNACIHLRHSGLWRKTGLHWKIKYGDCPQLHALLDQLNADHILYQALMDLDFHHFSLIQDNKGWRIEVETYAASEVIVRFPAMRRYIRLEFDQAQHLLNALARLQGRLAAPKRKNAAQQHDLL